MSLNFKFCSIFWVMAGMICACSALSQEDEKDKLQKEIIKSSLMAVSKLPAISFKGETNTNFADEYLKLNPKSLRYNHLNTHYNGLVSAQGYKIDTSLDLNDGKKLPGYSISYDGEHYAYLNAEGRPWIGVWKNSGVDAPFAVALGNFLYLPYAFLFESENLDDFRAFSLAQLSNERTWVDAFQNATITRMPTAADPTVEVKFNKKSGTSYVVTFAKEFIPIKFEKFEPEGKLAQRYTVQSWKSVLLPDGRKVSLPETAKAETFLSGWPRLTIDAKLKEVSVMHDIPKEDFQLDFGSVDSIIDEDTGVKVAVPR